MKVVGEMSQAAKADGYLVTMVPPESYLDPTLPGFDLSLLHAYPEWHPEFKYHGLNCYALLLAKYGTTGSQNTFDLVDIQLYESWAHAGYQIDVKMVPADEYLVEWIGKALKPFRVDFAQDPSVGLPSQALQISPSQLVVGFSAGAGDGKSVFIWPESVGVAWKALPKDLRPRGVMYWNMNLDGGTVNGTDEHCAFAQDFNSFLRVRDY
eukprot:m.1207568 g.1207568  ORF g.1207568 m.1207568 type:complete len:209 (+) comp24586_c0_seq96:2193-2819(+)